MSGQSEEAREIGAVCDYTVVPGVIHGLRRWSLQLEGERWRLTSISAPMIWPPRSPMNGTCLRDDFLNDDPPGHAPPGYSCSCGLYAFHPFGEQAEAFEEDVRAPEPGYGRSVGWTVCGVIAAWGRVEVHQDGFRAEHARPVALLVPVNWSDSHYERAIRQAADEYGIPAIEIENAEQLIARCARQWPGLAEELVDELLLDEFEVNLVPETNATILRDGSTIAGAGFVVDGVDYKPWFWDAEWPLEQRGLRILRVAGTKFTGDAIADGRFDPLKPLKLVAEPDNPHDPDAVAIYDESGEVRAGYIPKACSRDVASDLRNGSLAAPRVAWHWRDLATGRRIGLCIAVAHRRLPITVVDEPPGDEVITVITEDLGSEQA